MARDVFVSYSQPDRACAFEIVRRLENRGIGCWIAPRDIAPSAEWAAEIMDAICGARTMILVFSGSSNQSPQVRREVERAVHRQLSILPFRIEDVLPSKSLEFFLSTQHWMDAFPPPLEPHYARLCDYIEKTAGAGGSAVPVAVASMDSALLQDIERRLAGYIGPVARHLVREAARCCADVEELVAHLASELDAEPDRREFILNCRAGRPTPGAAR